MLPLAFVHGSTTSVFVFVAICIAILLAIIRAIVTARPNSIRLALGVCTWMGVYCAAIAAIVSSGILQRAFIPLGLIFLVGTVAIAISIGFTPLGRDIAARVPLVWLVGIQGFRLPLELVLHEWRASGTIPETMTWTGSNWDIVSGTMACLVCPFVAKRQVLAWLFNIVGIILLVNVGRVAILSSPIPIGWQVDPPLELILYLPYAYIVPICIGGAALGHVLLTRRLTSRSV